MPDMRGAAAHRKTSRSLKSVLQAALDAARRAAEAANKDSVGMSGLPPRLAQVLSPSVPAVSPRLLGQPSIVLSEVPSWASRPRPEPPATLGAECYSYMGTPSIGHGADWCKEFLEVGHIWSESRGHTEIRLGFRVLE